jgi:holin-like protein
MIILQFLIIFGCLAAGELIVYLTGVKIPSSILGMLLLTLLLKLKVIKLQWVEGMADILTKNLALFFIPPGVAIMVYFDLLRAEFWPILIAAFGSAAIVLIVTGHTHQMVRKLSKPK